MRNDTKPLIWAMLLIFIGLELAFQLSDRGLFPIDRFRWEGYVVLGFWDQIFEAVLRGEAVPRPFASWMAWTSLVTHAFVHGGLIHLLMNGVVFLSLGTILMERLGTAKFLALFAGTAAAGALIFGLISESDGPLVGASGALFGFIGALKAWEWKYLRTYRLSMERFWRTIGGLVLLNALLFFLFPGGALAWEAHLGGFVAGLALAPLLAPRAMGPAPF